MAKHDMDSIKRDMEECITHVASIFKKTDVVPDAASVTQLAQTMFNDYRGNNPRAIAEHKSEADKAMVRMKYKQ